MARSTNQGHLAHVYAGGFLKEIADVVVAHYKDLYSNKLTVEGTTSFHGDSQFGIVITFTFQDAGDVAHDIQVLVDVHDDKGSLISVTLPYLWLDDLANRV